jgi:hypothetical protein
VSRTEHEATLSNVKNSYRRTAGYQMDERRLLLRGGAYDGRTWVGVVAVGARAFVGDGPWATAGVYIVTPTVEVDDEGREANVAVPAFA